MENGEAPWCAALILNAAEWHDKCLNDFSFTHRLWWDNVLVHPQIFLQNVPLCCQVALICALQEYRLSNRLIPKPFSKASAIPNKEQGTVSMRSWNTGPSFLGEGGERRGDGAKSMSPLERGPDRTFYTSIRFITVTVSAAVVPCPKHLSVRGSELSLSHRTWAGHPLTVLKEKAQDRSCTSQSCCGEQAAPAHFSRCSSQQVQKGLFGGNALILKQRWVLT